MAQISEEEKLRRRQSNESVIGTNAMEGLHLDTTTLALMECFAEGEIDREQLSVAIDLHVENLLDAIRARHAANTRETVHAA